MEDQYSSFQRTSPLPKGMLWLLPSSNGALSRYISRCGALALLVLTLLRGQVAFGQIGQALNVQETIPVGSYVINMGASPQNVGSALRPYGLVYDLLDMGVPVKWVIQPNKGRNGVDLFHNGVGYTGGPFIILAAYRTPSVNALINAAVSSQGVKGFTTVQPITVTTYATLRARPKWTINNDHQTIVINYLENASIPAAAYSVKGSDQLDGCDDIFLIPHIKEAINTTTLDTWNNIHKGFIWLGCASGSYFDDNDWLSTGDVTGIKQTPAWSGTVSYDYNDEPPMQFLGTDIVTALQGEGENQSYRATWRPTTRKLIYLTNDNNRVAMAYGPAYGNTNRGWVMMQGAHKYPNLDSGIRLLSSTGTRNGAIAAVRAMLNFSFMSVVNKAVNVTLNGPSVVSVATGASYSLSLSPAGGSYTVQWASSCGGTFTPNATSSAVTFTPPVGVSSCVITATVTDGCGRESFDSKIVEVSQCELTATSSVQQQPCPGDNNGVIELNLSGGTAPYAYTWTRDGGGSGSGNNISNNTFTITDLAEGTYNLTVTDADNCSVALNSSTLNEVGQDKFTGSTVTNANCGLNNGTITIAVSGGIAGGRTFDWADLPGPNNARNRTGLAAGTYSLTVTGSTGCIADTSFIVGNDGSPSISNVSVTPVLCSGDATGAISFMVSGGLPPYKYLWNDGDTTAQNRTGLLAGSYDVTVTDANDCEVSRTGITVAGPTNPLDATSVITHPECGGKLLGAIDVTVMGGTAPYTYLWNNGDTTQDRTNLSAGVYRLTVTDANNCTDIVRRTLSVQSDSLTFTSDFREPTCGENNGSITISNVMGGQSPYTFIWNDGAATQNRTGLAAGTYSLTVTGGVCSAEAAFMLDNEGAPAIADITVTDVLCYGEATGEINFTVAGGVIAMSYDYVWNDGSDAAPPRTGLRAGAYSVTVTDDNNCKASANFSVNEPDSSLVVSAQITQPGCGGAMVGAIDVTAAGGEQPYTYDWADIPGANNAPDRTGLLAGTYRLTVTDANGCFKELSYLLEDGSDPITFVATLTQPSCGESTGSIIFSNLMGGGSSRIFDWDDIPGADNDMNRTGLSAGTYSLTITGGGCSIDTSFVLDNEGAPAIADITVTDVLCYGEATGEINFTVSGGVIAMSYDYAWNDGSDAAPPRTGLRAGAYSVTVTDDNNCKASANFSVNEPDSSLVVSVQIAQPGCGGATLGAIDVTAAGGEQPYTYDWADIPGVNNAPDRTGLLAGTYRLTVTDANGCFKELSYLLEDGSDLITFNADVIDASCGEANGSITLRNLMGGGASRTFDWADIPGADNDMNRTDLADGTYSLTINAGACSIDTSFTVGSSAGPAISGISTIDVLCFGDATGQINFTVSGGATPYGYAWNDGAGTMPPRTGLRAGAYRVTVTDANGCEASATGILVAEPASPISISGNVTNPVCAGASDGAIDVTVSGGTGPYTYQWADGPTAADRSNLTSGPYTLTVTDASGCTKIASYTLSPGVANILITIAPDHVKCNGQASGKISVSVNGGSSPYTFDWGDLPGTNNGQNRSNIRAGSYFLTVTDNNGCTATANTTVNEPDGIGITPTPANVLCHGSATGAISLAVSGGVTPYGYQWNDGGTSMNRTSLPAGIYSVTVTDANNCRATATGIVVSEPSAGLTLSATQTNLSCFGANDGTITVTPSGGTGPFHYDWSGSPTGDGSPGVSGLAAGPYAVTVTDANNCTAVLSATLTEPAQLTLSISPTNPTCPPSADPPVNSDGAIGLTVAGGVGPYTFAWATTDGTGLNPTSEDQSGLTAGTYMVTVTDATGCMVTASATLQYLNPNPGQPGVIIKN